MRKFRIQGYKKSVILYNGERRDFLHEEPRQSNKRNVDKAIEILDFLYNEIFLINVRLSSSTMDPWS